MKWWPFNGCHWLGGERGTEIYILMNSSGNALLKIKAAKIIKGASLGDENLRQQSSLERIRLVVSPFHTLFMLPKDSDSLPKDFFGWLWLHRKAYGLISWTLERTLVLITRVYFLLKNKSPSFVGMNPLVERSAAHTSVAGLCWVFRGRNTELDCKQNS